MKTYTSKLDSEQMANSWYGKSHFKKEIMAASPNKSNGGL